MNIRIMSWALVCGMVVGALLPKSAVAQLIYPSFQIPQLASREFNFAIADAGRTTSLVFQWREGVATRSQLSLDVGLADVNRDNSGLLLLVGGQYACQMGRSTGNSPLDLLFTAGVFTRLGDEREMP